MESGDDDGAPGGATERSGVARRVLIWGWVIALVGVAIWTYALFVDGCMPVVDWGTFSPAWIAEMLPNRQAELGLVLSFGGMIPIYYVQIQQLRGRA